MHREQIAHDDETGLTLYLIPDDDCESPQDHDDAVILCIYHRRRLNPGARHGFAAQDALHAFVKANCDPKRGQWAAFPLWAYEHGHIAYRVGPANPFYDPWDSGRIGVALVNLAEVTNHNDSRAVKQAKALTAAQGAADDYTAWSNGDCYGYQVEDANGESIDSCFGFVGSDSADDSAREAFAYAVADARKALAAALETARPDLYPA